MALNPSAEVHPGGEASSANRLGAGTGLPPWMFQHQELLDVLGDAERVSKKALTNMLNRIHFMGGEVLVHLRGRENQESILLRAAPQPCLGGELTCQWLGEELLGFDLRNYEFLHIFIADGKSLLLVPGRVRDLDRDALTIELPKKSYAVGRRQAKRYACQQIGVELSQNGFYAAGELLDFSPVGLRIWVKPEFSSFRWFNAEEEVSVLLRHNGRVLYSGSCACIRDNGSLPHRELVLEPMAKVIKRFTKKHVRNPRLRLVPTPTVSFRHPLLGGNFKFEVIDISSSGFSVLESADEGVLMPGMIIPGLLIQFPGESGLRCTAQVVYRMEQAGDGVRCGVAILDMDINAYSTLSHILTKAMDPHAYLSQAVDMNALWEFFFDSGFIYPTKYRLIQSYREDFRETYRKLYLQDPEIAKHFTYQKNGRIYGHISMVRAYERAWMIHHYAAKPMERRRTGFLVLKQMMHCLNDMCRLPSAKMDYVICYFRPENRFPNLVFGGFVRAFNDKSGCSVDLFAYLPYTSLSLGTELPEGWSLNPASQEDLWELRKFYSRHSGGLLLEALDLEQRNSEEESLEAVYARHGLLRRWRAFSLRHEERLAAVLVVDHSDLGLNLSELLNCIKILITHPEGLPWQVLSTAIARHTSGYKMGKVPVLFYPFEYVQSWDVPYEKRYHLWALDTSHGGEYMDFMQRKFKIHYE